MIAWNVFLNNKLIDTVFFTEDCDGEYIVKSLVDHDRYHPNILVQKRSNTVKIKYPVFKYFC